jgi:transcriptional regulator of heat shock response
MQNPSSHPLSDREALILRHVVAAYLETAEPVGSQAIADVLLTQGIQISSATVRNTLSTLDSAGLLEQPHTSAGRIPTRDGLIHYVNHLMEVTPLSHDDEHVLKSRLSAQRGDIMALMRETSRLLSQLSHYASLVVMPQTEDVIVDSPWGVMDQKELLSMDQLRHRLAILQEKARLMAVLKDQNQVGKADVVALKECSMVTAPYAEGRTILGCVGVMGPLRMDYSRAVPIVESAARYLGEWLEGQ